MDLAELLIQRGGSGLCRRVLLWIVHLQVPVYEVTLSKPDHFHTGKTRCKVTLDGTLRSERHGAGFIYTRLHGNGLPMSPAGSMRPASGSPDLTHLSPALISHAILSMADPSALWDWRHGDNVAIPLSFPRHLEMIGMSMLTSAPSWRGGSTRLQTLCAHK